MHYGGWDNGWGGGFWWSILMMTMMIVFWGGLIWFAVTLIRRANNSPHTALPAMAVPSATNAVARQTAQEILAERLARGEIEIDDYRQRLQALEWSTKE